MAAATKEHRREGYMLGLRKHDGVLKMTAGIESIRNSAHDVSPMRVRVLSKESLHSFEGKEAAGTATEDNANMGIEPTMQRKTTDNVETRLEFRHDTGTANEFFHLDDGTNMLDRTLKELTDMKGIVDEVYGTGCFYNVAKSKIIGLFDEREDITVIGGEKKLFAGAVDKVKSNMVDDDTVPLKPIANPRVEGGNIVVVVDDEDYHKGVDELKFSLIG